MPAFDHPAFQSSNPQHGPLQQGEEWKIRDQNGRDQTGRYTNLYFYLIRKALPEEINGLKIRVGESKPLAERHIRVRAHSARTTGVVITVTDRHGVYTYVDGQLSGVWVTNIVEYQAGGRNRMGSLGVMRHYPDIPAIQAAVARVARLNPEDLREELAWNRGEDGIPLHWLQD